MDICLLLRLLHTLKDLRAHERWPRSDLEVYQATALGQLREYAYAYSPFTSASTAV